MILEMVYVSGFAGILMLFAWIHVRSFGQIFTPNAWKVMFIVALLWPLAAVLLAIVMALGTLAESFLEKQKGRNEAAKQWFVHAGSGKSPIHPPYDGSQKRKRYWKKVQEVNGAVSLKRKSRRPRSRT